MIVHGLLLTGGSSTRMGADKATLVFEGRTLAAGVAEALVAVASPVLAVGPEAATGLRTVEDERRGPLVAIAAGRRALVAAGSTGPALVVACDLPFVGAPLLAALAREIASGADAVLPVAGGLDQTLCACYSPAALDAAVAMADAGARAMRDLIGSLGSVRRLAQDDWARLGGAHALDDVDTPEDWDLAVGRERPRE